MPQSLALISCLITEYLHSSQTWDALQQDRVRAELVDKRKQVTLFDDFAAIERWEDFTRAVWAAHPRAQDSPLTFPGWYNGHVHRCLSVFDGPFDEFVYFEADNLAMKPVDDVFGKLKDYDFVFDDWEHAKPESAAPLNLSLIESTGLYSAEKVRSMLHCGSFFASRKGFFDAGELAILRRRLLEEDEVKWINGKGWWDYVFMFNYMTLRCDRTLFNFTLSPDSQDRTGNCADADPFVNIDHVLYNKQGCKPIHRIHYMNYAVADFARLTRGEDVSIRYQDIFLHYRYLKEPENRPRLLQQPGGIERTRRKLNSRIRQAQKKIKLLMTT